MARQTDQRLTEVLKDKGIQFRESKRSLIFTCPECGKEEKCYLDKTREGYTSCFSCRARWNHWKKFLSRILGVSWAEASRLVLGVDTDEVRRKGLKFDDDVEQEDQEKQAEKPISLTPDFLPVEQVPRAMEYLKARGIEEGSSLIRAYDLRYHAGLDAVVFPVTRDGKLYGWQGRTVPPTDKIEGRLRLVFPSGFNKASHLLNYDRARSEKRIILVEGPFDCLHVDFPGFGAVCSFGKLVSHEQIQMLLRSDAEEIYLGLDPDAADEIGDLIGALWPAKRVFRITPPKGKKDFGECTALEVLDALEQAEECAGYRSARLEVYLKP